jgi:hypothetical protein
LGNCRAQENSRVGWGDAIAGFLRRGLREITCGSAVLVESEASVNSGGREL